jgi:hypothetical protein
MQTGAIYRQYTALLHPQTIPVLMLIMVREVAKNSLFHCLIHRLIGGHYQSDPAKAILGRGLAYFM